MTVKDKDGRSVTITDVSRVIVLTGDVAEIIWALGMSGSIVATDTSVTYPPEAQKAPKIGYMRILAAEGLLAQKPTLLIGGESADRNHRQTHYVGRAQTEDPCGRRRVRYPGGG